MAEFNREAPQVSDPQFLNYAKPISDVKADTSKGLAFKGIGDVFEDTVKGVQEGIQAKAGYDLEQQVRPLQDEYAQATQSALDRAKTGQSLIDPNTPKAPEGVESNITRAELLHSAKQNGNLTETAYLGKLYSILKDTRAQYPGFRDYIDKRMSAITGKDVANDYLKSMITDINSYSADKNKDLEHLKTETAGLAKEGYTAASDLWNGLHDGSISFTDGTRRLASIKADHANLADLETQLKTADTKGKLMDRPVEQAVRLGMYTDLKAISDQKIGGKSTAEWEQSYQAGNIKPGEEEAAIQQINRNEQQFEANFLKRNSSTTLSDGRSFSQALGKEKYDTILNEGKQYFTTLRDRFISKDFGLATKDAREVQYMNDRNSLALYKGQDGWKLQMLNNPLIKNSPESIKIMLDKTITDDSLNNFQKTVIGLNIQQMASGTNYPDGTKISLNKALETLQSQNKNNPNTTPQQEKLSYKQLTDSIGNITNPNIPPEMKLNLARAAYNPVQGSVVAKFSEQDGSRESVYHGLFSKDMVDNVWALNNPQLRDYVKTSAQQWFERDMLPGQLRVLQTATSNSDSKIRFAWDPKTSHITAVPVDMNLSHTRIGTSVAASKERMDLRDHITALNNNQLHHINSVMDDLKYMLGKDGGDVNAALVSMLDHAKAINPEITTGLPQKIYDAFNTHKQALENEQKRVKGIMTKDQEKAP